VIRPFRRTSIRSVIDQAEVVEAEICIFGLRTELLVMGGGAAPARAPSFVRKRRTRHDSNVWPPPSESMSPKEIKQTDKGVPWRPKHSENQVFSARNTLKMNLS
jgi:hypothetical protein